MFISSPDLCSSQHPVSAMGWDGVGQSFALEERDDVCIFTGCIALGFVLDGVYLVAADG